MQTFPLNYDKDAWIRTNIVYAINQKCTPSIAAERLGIRKKTASHYFRLIMLENSRRAVHAKHGEVRAYFNELWGGYFIFHGEEDRLLGFETQNEVDWKCPPLD